MPACEARVEAAEMGLWYVLGIGICFCIAALWTGANNRKQPLPRAPVRNERPRRAAAESLAADDGRRSAAAPARSRCATSRGDVDEEWQRVEGAQYARQFPRHDLFHSRSQDELCSDRSRQSSHASSQQQPHSDSMLPHQELEGRLAQLLKDMKRRDKELARANRMLIAKEAENEELKAKLALAAQESLRVIPSARRASESSARGDPVPATPLPTRSKSQQPVAGGKGRTENEEKPVRRTLTSGTRFLAANLSESCLPRTPPQLPRTPSKPSTVPTNEQPKVATDKSKADRGPESAASSGVGSEASRVVRDAGAAAGGRRLPNEGASLEARWSSVAISHGTTRGSPPEMPDVPPTPLVRFLQSLLCRVS